MDGGSWGLLGVLREHRGAVEYDFRTRFGVGLGVIGQPKPRGMSLAEAARHVKRIGGDPSSALAAEIEGWAYPVSRVEALLMDLWDVTVQAAGGKGAYPRPWKAAGETSRRGNAAGRTPDEIKAILREHFGQPEAPV